MDFYAAQKIYRSINNPSVRLGMVRTVRALRKRYLLLRVDTNDACNLRCVMCYFSDPNRKPMSRPMNEDMFTRLAEQFFSKTRYLYLSCGAEPFVTANFDRMLDIAGTYKVPFTSYCTNALLMKDKFIEATLRNHISEVIVSCDGGSKAVYERIRVGGRWELLNARLDAFRQACGETGGPKPILRFNYTVQEGNVDDLDNFIAWVGQWQPETVQLRLFRTLDGAVKQHDDVRTVRVFEEKLPALEAAAEKEGFRLLTMDTPEERKARLGADGSPFSGGMDAIDPAQGSLKRINCQLPWFNLYVTPDGSVRPCTVHHPVGNFMTQTLEEIDRSPAMLALRDSLRNNPDSVCIKCQLTGESGV